MEHVLEPSIWLIDESLNNLSLTDPDPEIIAHQNLISQFTTLLKNSPFYYISWHGQKKPWDEYSAKDIAEVLKDLGAEKKGSKSKKAMSDYEESDRLSGFKPIEYLTDAFSNAYICMELGEPGWSKVVTRYIHKAMQLAEGLNPLYLPAVIFLRRWIHLHLLILKGKLPKGTEGSIIPSSIQSYNPIKEFNQLSDKSKALVLGAKAYYLASMKKFDNFAMSESIDAMRELILLDPLTFEWHYAFGNWLRFNRRQVDKNHDPTDEEIRIYWESYENCDYVKIEPDGKNSHFRNLALASICQCLAEIIKFRTIRNIRNYPLHFGGLSFNNEQEAVDFVLAGVKRVMTEYEDPWYAELIRSGEILCNILPRQYRDYSSAEKYYKAALKIKPKKSKINHKLGIFYLTSPEHFDLPSALKYLRLSFETNRLNFPATIDLIKTLMSSPKENKEELETLFSFALNEISALKLKDQSQILCHKGYFKFMLGEKDAAIKCWIQAQPNHPYGNFFTELQSSIRRHKWNSHSVEVHEIKRALIDKFHNGEDNENASLKATHKSLIEFISAVRNPGQRTYSERQGGGEYQSRPMRQRAWQSQMDSFDGQWSYAERQRSYSERQKGGGEPSRQRNRHVSQADADDNWRAK